MTDAFNQPLPFESDDPVRVVRRPLNFEPSSVTQINHDRLPEPDARRDMSLAFRQDVSEEELESAIPRCFVLVPIAMCLIVFAALPLAPLLPVPLVAGAAAFISLIILGRATFTGAISLRLVVFALVTPSAFLGLAYIASNLIVHRLVVAGVLSAASLGALLLMGHNPLSFYRDWLAAHPRLKPKTRAVLREAQLFGPSWFILAGVLAIATVVPRFSSALAFLAVLGLCIGWILRRGVSAIPIPTGLDILSRYLTYGASTLDGPPSRPTRGPRCTSRCQTPERWMISRPRAASS